MAVVSTSRFSNFVGQLYTVEQKIMKNTLQFYLIFIQTGLVCCCGYFCYFVTRKTNNVTDNVNK